LQGEAAQTPRSRRNDAAVALFDATAVLQHQNMCVYSAGAGLWVRKKALADFTLFESPSTVGKAEAGSKRQVLGPIVISK